MGRGKKAIMWTYGERPRDYRRNNIMKTRFTVVLKQKKIFSRDTPMEKEKELTSADWEGVLHRMKEEE